MNTYGFKFRITQLKVEYSNEASAPGENSILPANISCPTVRVTAALVSIGARARLHGGGDRTRGAEGSTRHGRREHGPAPVVRKEDPRRLSRKPQTGCVVCPARDHPRIASTQAPALDRPGLERAWTRHVHLVDDIASHPLQRGEFVDGLDKCPRHTRQNSISAGLAFDELEHVQHNWNRHLYSSGMRTFRSN
jgi:hypothetical protein